MAIVADLYKFDQFVGEPLKLDAGNLRYVSRVLQQAGMLPKVKQGQTPPDINADHCVSFLFGIAGTGTAVEAADAVKRFRKLRRVREDYNATIIKKGDDKYFKRLPREAFCKLHDDLADLIQKALESDFKWTPPERIILSHDPKIPMAEIHWKDGRVWRYDIFETGVTWHHVYTHAAIFDGVIIEMMALLLEGRETE